MELLPNDVSLYIIKLSLNADTYWTTSLINKECYRYASEHVEVFQTQLIKSLIYQKEATLNIGSIVFSVKTNGMALIVTVRNIKMVFPNGILYWEKSFNRCYDLMEFHYESDETNCEFLRKMFRVLRLSLIHI